MLIEPKKIVLENFAIKTEKKISEKKKILYSFE